MACPFASFVIFYEDGTQLVENRYDPYSWDNAPKDGIWVMGILFDPLPLYFPHAKDENKKPIPIVDPLSGIHLQERLPIMKLKGRRFIYVGWFRMIDFIRQFKAKETVDKTLSLMIGYVYNPEGDCVIMFGKKDRTVVTFQHNIFKLHADENSIRAMGIDLEKCGMERENRQQMIKSDLIAEEQAI